MASVKLRPLFSWLCSRMLFSEHADYVLPVQSFAERDGTFTNGERRVQRFYTAQGSQWVLHYQHGKFLAV